MTSKSELRASIIDWLDDNYHFGDTESLLNGDDEKSLLKSGILDSLGYVSLIIFLENSCDIKLDRSQLTPENFDGIGKIIRHVSPLIDLETTA